VNTTDADLFEYEGNTYLFYHTGWQDTRGSIRVAMYAGTMKECLESYFPTNVPPVHFNTREKKFVYPEGWRNPE